MESLYTYKGYSVFVGEVWLDDRKELGPGYVVKNDNTGIVEAERTNLPECIHLAKRLASMLEDLTAPEKVPEVPTGTPPVISKA